LRIDINEKYVITSDTDQFIVSTKGIIKTDRKDTITKEGVITKEGAKAGDEYLSPVGYLATVEQCFRYLLQRQIRESNASGFKAVVAEVERIEKELKEAIRI
jgi:hypothetical protein